MAWLTGSIAGAASAFSIGSAPLAAESVHTDIFEAIAPCFMPVDDIGETVVHFAEFGWIEEPDRADLPNDALNALTWAFVARNLYDELPAVRIISMFETEARTSAAFARKQDIDTSATRVLSRRGEGEIDTILVSLMNPVPEARTITCVVAAGPSASARFLDPIREQDISLDEFDQAFLRAPLEVNAPDALRAGASVALVNIAKLEVAPETYGRDVAAVLQTNINYKVQEN